MGLVYGEQKNYPRAIEQLSQILSVRPSELKVRDYLGYLYEETKDYQKAIEAYRREEASESWLRELSEKLEMPAEDLIEQAEAAAAD